jgi:hypothetical protein
MARKIEAAATHGIDAFIFDWYFFDPQPEPSAKHNRFPTSRSQGAVIEVGREMSQVASTRFRR